MDQTIHATAIVVAQHGVLIRGASGSGKSTLALAFIEPPGSDAILVADDRVHLTRSGDALIATPPDRLAGLIEARGIGILQRPHRPRSAMHLVVDLLAAELCIRLPDDAERSAEIHGKTLPRLTLPIATSDMALRVRIALREWLG